MCLTYRTLVYLVTCFFTLLLGCSTEDPDGPSDTLEDAGDVRDGDIAVDTADSLDDADALDIEADGELPFTCWTSLGARHIPEYDGDCNGVEACDMPPTSGPQDCQCSCSLCDYGRCMAVSCDEDPRCREDASP